MTKPTSWGCFLKTAQLWLRWQWKREQKSIICRPCTTFHSSATRAVYSVSETLEIDLIQEPERDRWKEKKESMRITENKTRRIVHSSKCELWFSHGRFSKQKETSKTANCSNLQGKMQQALDWGKRPKNIEWKKLKMEKKTERNWKKLGRVRRTETWKNAIVSEIKRKSIRDEQKEQRDKQNLRKGEKRNVVDVIGNKYSRKKKKRGKPT